MENTKIRSWNKFENQFFYFQNGKYFKDSDCKKCVSERICSEFIWRNAEWCTNLKDKNGKEIYEGDIILFQKFSNWDDDSMKRHKATVIFKEGCFMWEILEFGKKSVINYANATEPLRNTNSIWGLEVIGNISENPELLTD